LYLTKNESNTDDLVQETYLSAFKFLKNDKESSNVKAWLFKIMMNTFINKYRKDKRKPSLVDFDSVESFYGSLEEEAQMSLITENETGNQYVIVLTLNSDEMMRILKKA